MTSIPGIAGSGIHENSAHMRLTSRPWTLRALSNRLSWSAAFVGLGLALRLFHYLRNPSLWHDEAALVLNVLDKNFAQLLGPLRFSEAAPPLFLWIERAASLTLGDSLYALRLAPLAASCATLVLFARLARRTLEPRAAAWATLLFATSDRLLWHACEAKQYSLEALATVVLLSVFEAGRTWPLWRRALALAALAPLVLCVAYPACFVYGALLVVLSPVFRTPRTDDQHTPWADWLAYSVLVATVFATFAWLWIGPIHAQRDRTIVECWQGMGQFPDWRRPASVPGWFVQATLDVIGYCLKPIGQWLAPLAAVGFVALWRRRGMAWCLLLVGPIALAAFAAAIGAYPYGGMRVMVYAAPAVVLLVAAGVPPCLAWLQSRRRWAAATLAVLLLVPVARAGYQAVVPWQRADCASAAAHVLAHRRGDEPVTANHWEYLYYFRDLGRRFSPIETWQPPTAGRAWVVVTGARDIDREPCLALFAAPGWRTLDRREFDRATVLLVERPAMVSRSPNQPKLLPLFQ